MYRSVFFCMLLGLIPNSMATYRRGRIVVVLMKGNARSPSCGTTSVGSTLFFMLYCIHRKYKP